MTFFSKSDLDELTTETARVLFSAGQTSITEEEASDILAGYEDSCKHVREAGDVQLVQRGVNESLSAWAKDCLEFAASRGY